MHMGRIFRGTAILAVLSLVTTACLGGGDDAGGGSAEGEGGGTVTVLDRFTAESDVAGFDAAIALFEEQSGHTVETEHSPAFDETALTRVEGGNPPDVIIHPQPGLLEDFADQGAARPLDFLDAAELEESLVAGLVDIGTFDDQVYGVPVKLQLKSNVWFAADNFEEQGYEQPATWDDMLALSEEIAATGTTPWCIGIESAADTGWVATDWVEDIMLRLHGPETYDAWVEHELLFDSPEVTEAFEYLEEIWFNPDFVLGGTQNILATPFADAAAPMFQDPPGCLLHRQASFIESEFPDDAAFNEQYGLFIVPPIDESVGNAGLTAGDTAALYTDNAAAEEFIEFLLTPEAQEAWAAEGGYLCSIKACDPSVYPTESLAVQGEFLSEAAFVRFDASDLMPAQVGAGAFWTETVAWISGSQDLQTTLSNIDAAWPEDGAADGDTETDGATATETDGGTAEPNGATATETDGGTAEPDGATATETDGGAAETETDG